MKQIDDFMYDDTGLCPVCGSGLIPVPYYSAVSTGQEVHRTVQYPEKIKTTVTHYADLKQHYAGWCEDCARKAFEEKQAKLSADARKPSPALWIIGAVLTCGGFPLLLTNGGYGTLSLIGMLCMFVGLPLFIGGLASYTKKKKIYTKRAGGWKESFPRPTEEGLSFSAAYGMRKTAKGTPAGNRVYLDLNDIEKMRRQGQRI